MRQAVLPEAPPKPVVEALAQDNLDDAQLIEAAQRDSTQFAPLYRRYVTPIYRYCYSRTGNVPDAEDLTSQIFLEALKGLPRYHHRGHFIAWLFTIARRRAADHYRRPGLLPLDDDLTAAAECDPSSGALRADDLESLRQVVTRLNDRDRELLHLRFAGGLTFAQMAALLGKREGAVKMALARLLDRLQRVLGGER